MLYRTSGLGIVVGASWLDPLLFPTCQVRVVRFYKSCPLLLVLLLSPSSPPRPPCCLHVIFAVIFASFTLQWAAPDLNCKLQIAVGSAGPQRGARERWAAPDLSRKEQNARRYVRKYARKNVRRYVRKHVRRNVRRYVRKNVRIRCHGGDRSK